MINRLIGARAGKPARSLLFSKEDFFVPNYRIFHCLNMPQNSPNLEYRSHLVKNVIIYHRCDFPPLGGAIIKESAFWLITAI